MSEESDGAGLVGVVGDADGTVASACRRAGVDVVDGEVETVLEAHPDGIVAVGEPSFRAVALADAGVPVLPVDAGRGVRSVPGADVSAAITAVRDGAADVEDHPILTVQVAGEARGRALFDVLLVTAEPAAISEYRVTNEDETVARFRADGVVTAPPAGTPGYASAAGSPVVPAGPPVCTVVPIAPFATTLADWVLPIDTLGLAILRESANVELVVDGERRCSVGVDTPVTLETRSTVSCFRVAAGRSPFGRPGR
jgi:NAD+ kinase